jgi:hypothetical protein
MKVVQHIVSLANSDGIMGQETKTFPFKKDPEENHGLGFLDRLNYLS